MAKFCKCFERGKNSGQKSPEKDAIKTSRVLLGKLKHYRTQYRSLFELGLPENASKSSFFFPPLEPPLPQERVRFEGQTFPQWKIQRDFQKLSFRQRRRLKQRKIYILPIGPFPNFVGESIYDFECSLFELLRKFVSIFYLGFDVELKDVVNLDELCCKTRIHGGTGKKQILVGDVLAFLRQSLPDDAFLIIGITWEDMYPSNEWNFVLGEASSVDGCAAMSFGHYEPQQSQKIYPGNKNRNSPDKHSRTHDQHCINQNENQKSERTEKMANDEETTADSVAVSSSYEGARDRIDKIDAFQIWKFFRVISHELGHVFGLTHCLYFYCAMNESSTVQEAIDQPLFMCPVCLKKIQTAVGFDIEERYNMLKEFLEMVYSGLIGTLDQGNEDKDILKRFSEAIEWLKTIISFLEES